MVNDMMTIMPEILYEEEEDQVREPSIVIEVNEDRYGKFVIEPLEPGYGVTLGNPLRRILYNGLEGVAITSVKIDGVQHEYQTIPNIREQVTDILLNIKAVRLRSEVDRPGSLKLDVGGEGEVSAADIMASADFEVVNPELRLATLDAMDARLSMELYVEHGKGYRDAPQNDGQAIGVLPIDAVFTPIRKANYNVELTRVGRRTDYERLVMEVWTDGSITPADALQEASNILVNQFFLFSNIQFESQGSDEVGVPATSQIQADQYNIPVERLEIGSRTLNCLKRAGINKVGEVLEKTKAELMSIRNFGEKSYAELYDKLRENNLLPPEETEEEGEPEEQEETEAVAASD